MKQFINENKVFILGLLGSLMLTLQEFVGKSDISFKVIAFAVLMAALKVSTNRRKRLIL